MLRWDRNNLPDIPRPVFEIQAEQVDDLVRLAVMAGPGWVIEVTEIRLTDAASTGNRIRSWLRAAVTCMPLDPRWCQVINHIADQISERLVAGHPPLTHDV